MSKQLRTKDTDKCCFITVFEWHWQ